MNFSEFPKGEEVKKRLGFKKILNVQRLVVFCILALFTYWFSCSTRLSHRQKLNKIYEGNEKTFYCGCLYSQGAIDFDRCEYKPRKNIERAKRLEWEHIVPMSTFGKHFSEWTKGHPSCVSSKGKKYKGRKCAGKMNPHYQKIEADPVNIVPSVGEINADRSDYHYGEIPGEERKYGNCDFEVRHGIAEPTEHIRGDIARIYFYMNEQYPNMNVINDNNQTLFKLWNDSDPVSKEEQIRNKNIYEIFGVYNRFVNDPR